MALRKRTTQEMNFEQSLQKLEAIVKRLEEEEIPLEESLKLFAEGQTLTQACERQLHAAENQIRQLMEKGAGKIEETDFDPGALVEGDEAEDDDDEDEADEKGCGPAPAKEDSPTPKKNRPAGGTMDELPF